MYLLLISVLVILTGLYVIFNKELFSNNNNKKAKSVVKATMHSITADEREYVKFLVQNIVENVNQKYSKKLSLGDVEQVEKQKRSSSSP